MPGKPELRIGWATYAAAKHACTKWHYSGSVPAGKLINVGAWEGGRFIGVVLFGRGANNRLASAYGLGQDQACELVRIALRDHVTPVTRIVRIALKFLRENSPDIRLAISYADPKQGHHGGIYQGGGWIYSGASQAQRGLLVSGKFMHKRTAHSRYGTASPEKITAMTGLHVEWAPVEWKHTYLMPLDADMRKQITPLAKPYPKRTKDQDCGHPSQLGGETPTRALHIEAEHARR